LHNQIFIEIPQDTNFVNVIGVKQILNSLYTHGTGIVNSVLNKAFGHISKTIPSLLDILLDEGDAYNGIQVAQKVRELNKNVVIIFVTKTAQFAIDGYKVDAIDYILKPLVYEDFYLKLVKAMNVLKYHVEKELVFKNSDGIFKIKESEIVYIEVRKHYLYFQLKNKTETFRGTMKEISQELTNQFKKSSNSFLANLQYIKLIKKDSVILECDNQTYQIPLTKLFRNSFILALENYSGRN
jgi:DNA-binding LytR/AlgR family response regulator